MKNHVRKALALLRGCYYGSFYDSMRRRKKG